MLLPSPKLPQPPWQRLWKRRRWKKLNPKPPKRPRNVAGGRRAENLRNGKQRLDENRRNRRRGSRVLFPLWCRRSNSARLLFSSRVIFVGFRHVRLGRVAVMNDDAIAQRERFARLDRIAAVALRVAVEVAFPEGVHGE